MLILDVLNKFHNPESVIVAEAVSDERLYYGGVEVYVKGKLLDLLTSYPDSGDDKCRARNALLYIWL